MFAMKSRAVGMTLGVMLTVLAGCGDEPSPTAPMPDVTPSFAVGDVLLVTTTSGGTEVGSLRWAVSHLTGGEIISFAPGLAGQTIVVDTTIVVDEPFTLQGPAVGGIRISGGGKVRVLDIFLGDGEEAVLRNLTIADGYQVNGTGIGAGIIVRGFGNSLLRVENSTLTRNVASSTPAISGISTVLVNTTVSGNTATGTSVGPAVFSTQLSLVNSTVAHNASGGVSSGKLVLRNSIISNHAGKPNCTNSSTLNTYEGKNISDDDSCGGPLEITIADPVLGPLAANGGPAMTHAIAAGSPAINGGANCTVNVDQRYAPRDAQCDLGAFEFVDFTRVDLTMASSATFDDNGWAALTGTVKCSRNETFALRVRLHQTQRSGRSTSDVDATATTPIACTTSVRSWSVSLGTTGQPFQSGSAVAGASTLSTDPWVTPASLSQSVKLFKGRK